MLTRYALIAVTLLLVVCAMACAQPEVDASEDVDWGFGIIATTAARRAAVMGTALVLALIILWLVGRRKEKD